MIYSVFSEPPKDFSVSIVAAGCICECENKILWLKRQPDKPQGNTWAAPGGKLEKGEDPRTAVIREIKEEIGLNIDDEGLKEIAPLYIRLPYTDFVFHLFHKFFLTFPSIILEKEEHQEARWVTLSEAMQLPLIMGGKEALDTYNKWIELLRSP